MGSRTPLISGCWKAVGGDPAALDGLVLERPDAWLGGPLAVDDLAVGAVASALLAAAELSEARGGHRPAVGLSAEHVALSFRSERYARGRGAPVGAGFAPLSRFVCCRDGWARTHGNYPHHAAALERALGMQAVGEGTAAELGATGADSDAAAELERRAAEWDAVALEEAVVQAGGCAAALRTPEQWTSHPAGGAASDLPLVAYDERLAVQLPRSLPGPGRRLPAGGIRVLDLTRVIAGPVAGRTLAALGAEVLRIDPPALPELPQQHLDTGPGKRTALLDLADADRREALLAGADVLLTGYRPGALDRYSLSSEALTARHPHLIQVSLSAWGTSGPWAGRRGFDSLVQIASGIAARCTSGNGTPGVLPAQALDHATGHLMAAAALHQLTRRARGQAHSPALMSLARTAAELLNAPPPASESTEATGRADPDRCRTAFGDIELIAPPGTLDGVPLRGPHGPRPLGGDAPAWS